MSDVFVVEQNLLGTGGEVPASGIPVIVDPALLRLALIIPDH